jgi:hypothetical protein
MSFSSDKAIEPLEPFFSLNQKIVQSTCQVQKYCIKHNIAADRQLGAVILSHSQLWGFSCPSGIDVIANGSSK